MSFIEDYLTKLKETFDGLPYSQIARIKDILLRAYRENKKVFIMGNGGSAATASHFACDLGKRTAGKDIFRKRFKVIALTDNVSLLTAWANDAAYENIFLEQLKNLLDAGDIVIAISGSGNSRNVLRAVEYANANGALTIGFTGFEGGKLKDIAKECLIVLSNSMEQIEDIHLILEHLLCVWLRKILATRVVFLDRDGVICKDRDDYVKSWDEFVWIPGAREALRRLSGNHHMAIVVTNQSAVGRGLTSRLSVEDIHRRMMRGVQQVGGRIERVYYCPHQPEDGCSCRKPKPGLLVTAAEDYTLDLKSSYLVGDSLGDIEAGRHVGCTTIMVRNGKKASSIRSLLKGNLRPDHIVSDLSEAVDLILKLDSAER
ncbi:MAG: D-glycero-beta-D-manno-heptose 1,7-bisphosphate 7-phosphatase [bacterium]